MTTPGYHIQEIVEEAKLRWLKPGEVLFILQNYEEKQLTHEPPQKPPSGSLFLFDRKVLRFFRKDGHNWRRKKDGKNLGEAHERLRVGNIEALNCYYAHAEQNPNFQRRSYWMLNSEMENIVLVHYRDTTPGRNIAAPFSASSPRSSLTFVQSSNSYASQLTRSSAACNEIGEPYQSTSSPSCIEVSSDSVTQPMDARHLNLIERTKASSCSPKSELDHALRSIEEQLGLDDQQLKDTDAIYSENEDSYFSGLMVDEQSYNSFGGIQDCSNNDVPQQYPGYSGRLNEYQQNSLDELTSKSQQPSIWRDMLNNFGSAARNVDSQANMCPSDKSAMLLAQPRSHPVAEKEHYKFGDIGAKNDLSMLLPHELKRSIFSSTPPARNMYESDPDYTTMLDQDHIQVHLKQASSLTIAQKQKLTIREIFPDWGYATESTKVLIIGDFKCNPSKCEWTCTFDNVEVPAEIIQDGVICCHAPPHFPGKVSVHITSSNQESHSDIMEFEYRDKPSTYENPSSTKTESPKTLEELLLLARLVQMILSDHVSPKVENTTTNFMDGEDSWDQVIEALLDGGLALSSATDWVLEQLLKDKLQQWLSSRLQDNSTSPGLSRREQGIIHMVSGLGLWWALNPILDSGVNVNFRDINGWTALHWAARFGREKMVAELLASGAFAGAITDPSNQDPTGKTAASIAFVCGHKGLAGYLSEMSLTRHLSSLTIQETELSRTSADIEAEKTVNSISKSNLAVNEDQISLNDTLAAVRNATQAAARIQSAFRAHSFRRRQQKEYAAYGSEDEYGIFPSDIEGLSAASKLTFRNFHDHHAALSIQKKFRGWKGRRDFVALRQKIVKIQAHVRGHQVRKSYKVICWAVGMVEKIILRWRRKGAGLRGFRNESESVDKEEDEDEDVVKAFRKQKVDVAVGEAVSRVLSMVDSRPARQQYHRMLENYRQAKAERGGVGGEVINMENDDS